MSVAVARSLDDALELLAPRQALGQIEGGIAQGVGLAVMEEIVFDEGRMRTAAIAGAVRDATGLALTRVPIRPVDVVLGTL
jgi:CO/xanthine dehydrogenase Mo-binding subunit